MKRYLIIMGAIALGFFGQMKEAKACYPSYPSYPTIMPELCPSTETILPGGTSLTYVGLRAVYVPAYSYYYKAYVDMKIIFGPSVAYLQDYMESCLSYVLTAPGRVGETSSCSNGTARWVSVRSLPNYGWTYYRSPGTWSAKKGTVIYSWRDIGPQWLASGRYTLHVRTRDHLSMESISFTIP